MADDEQVEGEAADEHGVIAGEDGLAPADTQALGGDTLGNVVQSSAPPAAAHSGDPLDDATKRALNPDEPNPAQGESSPPGSAVE